MKLMHGLVNEYSLAGRLVSIFGQDRWCCIIPDYDVGMQTVALDPRYGQRKTREFISGGVAGQLLLNSKVNIWVLWYRWSTIYITRQPCTLSILRHDAMLQGWLGNKDTVLHSGEGVVSIARWSGKFVAWANDRGVKVNSACWLMCWGTL